MSFGTLNSGDKLTQAELRAGAGLCYRFSVKTFTLFRSSLLRHAHKPMSMPLKIHHNAIRRNSHFSKSGKSPPFIFSLPSWRLLLAPLR